MRKAKGLSETDIKHQIAQYLTYAGAFNFHLLAGIGAYKGAPDKIFIYKGESVYLEIKTATGVQSDYQKAFQAAVERAGGVYALVRSVDDVIGIIAEINAVKGE